MHVKSIPGYAPTIGIFYWEVLAVLSAFHWLLGTCLSAPQHVVIYCDNTNCVDMFSSLRASALYNPILITLVDLILFFDTQLQVVHILGAKNTIADALSRFNNDSAALLHPGLFISPFLPPHLSLGADLL